MRQRRVGEDSSKPLRRPCLESSTAPCRAEAAENHWKRSTGHGRAGPACEQAPGSPQERGGD
eukprot:4018873-Alexandrium_andersonii.AAC.1